MIKEAVGDEEGSEKKMKGDIRVGVRNLYDRQHNLVYNFITSILRIARMWSESRAILDKAELVLDPTHVTELR